jgi:hypothetical protein
MGVRASHFYSLCIDVEWILTSYINGIATYYSSRYLDRNVRVNTIFTSYSVQNGEWSQDLGDAVTSFYFPNQDSMTMILIPANSTTAETVTVT